MAEISAKVVMDLRGRTGCGMMDCKKALVETDGDFDGAVKVLRERGLAVAAKKADRIAAEGLVAIKFNDAHDKAAMIEVNSETDFVAKNADFQAFVDGLLDTVLACDPADNDALMACAYAGGADTVEAALKDKIYTIGENIQIRRFVVAHGTIGSYVHGKGQTGILVEFDADDAAKNSPDFAVYAKNIALQLAGAGVPAVYVNKEDVPQSALDEEKEIIKAQIANDEKNKNKPEAIIEKMVMGKLSKFYEKYCLCEQEYVKDDKMTVAAYTAATAKELGGSIKIKNFYRFEKGEGLQKREDNFAEEIASMIK